MGKLIKGIIGIALVALGAWTIYLWNADLLVLVRGGIGLCLILAGLIAFALISD
ncbi:MAG: hypothetical protein WCV91_04595 [Candidatus Margulisiibacteriota bacterium]